MKLCNFLRFFLTIFFMMFSSQARAEFMEGVKTVPQNAVGLEKQDFFEMYVPMFDCKKGQFKIEFTRFGEEVKDSTAASCPQISIQVEDLKLKIFPNDPDNTAVPMWQWIPFEFSGKANAVGDLIIQLPDRDPETAQDYEPGMNLQELDNFTQGAILDRRVILTIKQQWYHNLDLNPKDRIYILEPNTELVIHTIRPYETYTQVKLEDAPILIDLTPQYFNILGSYRPMGNTEALRILFRYLFENKYSR